MSKQVDTSKSRVSRADAAYMFQRPWLTTKSTRDQLRKMLTKKTKSESDSDSNDGDAEE